MSLHRQTNRSCLPTNGFFAFRTWIVGTLALIAFWLWYDGFDRLDPISTMTYWSHNDSKKIGNGYGSEMAHLGEMSNWKKPQNLHVVAMVFYGRKEFVSILNCYLQRNLVENGGLLDEVLFILRTDIQSDIEYLNQLVKENPTYRIASYDFNKSDDFGKAWEFCENGKMYIKIDDDVIFIEDSTIRAMVKKKFEHPEYLIVSSNSMNQPGLSWIHHHLGVVKPYLPELEPPPNFEPPVSQNQTNRSWRVSDLPKWKGPPDFIVPTDFPAPFDGHRWLPANDVPIERTPIGTTTYDADGPGYWQWTLAAQQHYSFLENLEEDRLWMYKFDTWNFYYDHMSINMIAIMGDDVNANLPFRAYDEVFLTETLPAELGRPVVIDGNGLSVHFGFRPHTGPQGHDGILGTDALRRYRGYAEEFICKV